MALTALLAACGQSGPLYMPDHPPESQKPRAQRAQPAPTAAPASTPTAADQATATEGQASTPASSSAAQ